MQTSSEVETIPRQLCDVLYRKGKICNEEDDGAVVQNAIASESSEVETIPHYMGSSAECDCKQ